MNFHTVVLRKNSGYWVALCLENGIIWQGNSQEDAIKKLKEAIESFEEVYESESNIYKSTVSIDELHEFLSIEEKEQDSEIIVASRIHPFADDLYRYLNFDKIADCEDEGHVIPLEDMPIVEDILGMPTAAR
ncbi:type II toxin-antitoxin system HicB family antitoxin [Nostoc sp.]|uniref:type II toxin-antitoxin system HicB family antitoxin n=1 Tax=Nostoc sp. TaxID=1180 RepID=UPI002FF65C2D